MCRHDFNESLGKVKVQSFQAKFPEAVEQLKAAWVEYMKYCYRVEEGEEVDSVAQNRATPVLMDLDRDVKGFPLVPPASSGDGLTYMKRVIRSFVTAHYRKFAKIYPLCSCSLKFARFCFWPPTRSGPLEAN